MTLEHSQSMYRYFVKHRSPGRRRRAAAARVGRRCGRARSSVRGRGERVAGEGRRAGGRRGHAAAPAHRDRRRSRCCPWWTGRSSTTSWTTWRPTASRGRPVLARTSRRCSTRSCETRTGGRPSSMDHRGAPLGTAGAIANALDHLGRRPFLVLNGDILTDLDLTALVGLPPGARRRRPPSRSRRWRTRGRTGWSTSTPTAGCARSARSPRTRSRATVNTGTYVLEPVALRGVPDGVARVDRDRDLSRGSSTRRSPCTDSCPTRTGWTSARPRNTCWRRSTPWRAGSRPRVPGPTCDPRPTCSMRPSSGRGWWSGPARPRRRGGGRGSVLLAGVRVGRGAVVRDTIAGPRAAIGDGARVEGAVLAEGAVGARPGRTRRAPG